MPGISKLNLKNEQSKFLGGDYSSETIKPELLQIGDVGERESNFDQAWRSGIKVIF